MKRDIFISYRRKGGIQTALWLKRELEQLGYDVFLDIEGMDHGPFDEQIYTEIDTSNNFILILSPDALDRCCFEDDWVRKEIVYALKTKKNIIPFMLEDFSWPRELPDVMADLCIQQGVKFVTEYPTAVIERLTTLFIRHKTFNNCSFENHISKSETYPFNDDIINITELEESMEIIEPHKKKMLGFGFDSNDIKSIVYKLINLKSELQCILADKEPDSFNAYRNAMLIMLYVKKQLASYNYWNFSVDKAINIFEKNYESNLVDVERSIKRGERLLSDDDKLSLNQVVLGLEDIIESFGD